MSSVKDPKNTPERSDRPDAANAVERRRIGKVVHDDRGNASVEWRHAPADYERPVLAIEQELSIQSEERFDPYHRTTPAPRNTGNTTRTDLRKLSEWIKLMREMEAKKRGGSDE